MKICIREWYADNREDVYHIYIFGFDKESKSVCLDVTNFTPFFYVKIPSTWSMYEINKFALKYRSKSHSVQMKIDAYGFSNNKEQRFLRLVYNNSKYMYYSKKDILEKENLEIYNGKLDPMLAFIHIKNIKPSGWIKIHDEAIERSEEISRCFHDITCSWKSIKAIEEPKDIEVFHSTLSFDIECYSCTHELPSPHNPENKIVQIGCAFQELGEIKKIVIVLGACNPVKNVTIIPCKNEYDVISKFVKLVEKHDPSQIIGYNIDGFDWEYIWVRACMLKVENIRNLSRLYHIPSEFKKDKMESKAYGMNIFNYIQTPGVGQIDLLHWFRKNTKLESYSLNNVSKKFLNENKRDVDHLQIFEMTGPKSNPKSRAIVADYCAQDTLLPLRLMENRCMLTNLIEMSKVTYVPLTWLITRGQQIKVYSQIQKELRKQNYLLPDNLISSKDKFTGATVLSAERASYFQPISGLDFKSLYPSIMIAHNLCITTFVVNPEIDLSNVEVSEFDVEGNKYKFVQSVKGVIPGILDRLWNERNKTKKEMKIENNKRLKAILNGKQLAIKLSMNSIYGVMGGSVGLIFCKPIAATVTATGRKMIEHSKNCAEKWYNGSKESNGIIAKVRYGDSVIGTTPLILKNKENVYVNEIKSFDKYDGWSEWREVKEQLNNHNVIGKEIWTSSGWKKIKRVVRHKKGKKKLIRVISESGIVEATDEHSFLDPKLVLIKKPEIGQKLLINNLPKKL